VDPALVLRAEGLPRGPLASATGITLAAAASTAAIDGGRGVSIRTGRALMAVVLPIALVTACDSTPSPSPVAPAPSPAITTPLASVSPTAPPAEPTPAVPSPSATVGPASLSLGDEVRVAGPSATEPVVATHPTDPDRIAVAYFRWTAAGSAIGPGLRVSHDGGATWRDVARAPWQGSGRVPGWHAAIAWGPGPTPGSARLYWTDMTSGAAGDQRLSVAYTDDEGATWSKLYVERRTRAWVGGFPDITVDRDPSSPGFGVVYVVYNWPADDTTGPGIRLLASGDQGRTWQPLEVPKATPPKGFPAAWRIDARVRTAPDGSAYVAAFQADMRVWDSDDIFRRGPGGNVGRAGFSVTRVAFDRASGSFSLDPTTMPVTLALDRFAAYAAATPGTEDNVADPTWSMSLDIDRSTGRVLLAVGDYRARPSGSPRGVVRVGRSDDRGASWSWTEVPALPKADGRVQSAYRPSLVALDRIVVVAMRGITDVPGGTSPARRLPTIGAYVAMSSDGGATFGAPEALDASRWNAAALSPTTNGPGLRERAERLADGRIVYTWADGRLGGMPPDLVPGRSAVFAVVASIAGR
jgi:hypothetical protein